MIKGEAVVIKEVTRTIITRTVVCDHCQHEHKDSSTFHIPVGWWTLSQDHKVFHFCNLWHLTNWCENQKTHHQ